MQTFAYTALIRTCNSFPTVRETIESLRAQTLAPARIVVVDSGSDPEQRAALRALVDDWIDYPDEPFNYSKAINIGLPACRTPYLLIVSSHVVFRSPDLVERAQRAAEARGAFAFYLCSAPRPWAVESITRRRFDGRNGLFNYCAFVPAEAVRSRPFREEVFSAEDQEWAAYHMRAFDATFVRVETNEVENLNPHVNALKFVNEEIAIAYFVCREKLGMPYLASWLLRAALAFVRGHSMRSKAHLAIFRALLSARRRAPVRASKYY